LLYPPFTQALSALAFEINRGRIEEHKLQAAEQILMCPEKVFFDQVLVAPGRKNRSACLILELLTQKGHGPVEVMKFKVFGAFDCVIAAPPLTKAVGARNHQPVQQGQKQGPLDVEFKFAILKDTPNLFAIIPLCHYL
jgi:hypothetical protein